MAKKVTIKVGDVVVPKNALNVPKHMRSLRIVEASVDFNSPALAGNDFLAQDENGHVWKLRKSQIATVNGAPVERKAARIDVNNLPDYKSVIKNGRYICGLAERWNDEKEYESIDEYRKAIEKHVRIKIVKMHKSPFGFSTKSLKMAIKLHGTNYEFVATAI